MMNKMGAVNMAQKAKKKRRGGRRKGPRKPKKKKVRAPNLAQVSFQGETYVVLPRNHELCIEVPANAPAAAPGPVNQAGLPPDVCSEQTLVFEDFETNSASEGRSQGWNVSKFEYSDSFTHFLGRFGQNQVVAKEYGDGIFEGEVTSFDGVHYHVHYPADGDEEELSEYEFDDLDILS